MKHNKHSPVKKGTAVPVKDKPSVNWAKLAVFQYHYLFLVIGLIFGLRLVFVNPPWQANDEDRHFFNAWALSQGNIIPEVENGKVGHRMPASLSETVGNFQGVPLNDTLKFSKPLVESATRIPLNKKNIVFQENPTSGIIPFPYIPAALMIKTGAIFRNNPVWLGWWGRIGTLFAYLAVVFIAIKIIPHFKALLMVIALSPMALYQGASVSYDALSFAFLFLIFALIIRFYYQDTPITFTQILVFSLAALFQRLSKDGYFILYFTLFAISIRKFASWKVYAAAFLLLAFASFIPAWLWSAYISSLNLPPTRFQVDFRFDLMLNVKFHLKDPLNAVSLIIQNVFNQGREWLSGAVGRFGYSYTLLPGWAIFLQFIAFIFIVMVEKPQKVLSMKFRLPVLGLTVLNFLAFMIGGFLVMSAIGANKIFGMQGRYFTPLLPWFFVSVFYLPLYTDREKWLRWTVPAYCVMILWYTQYFLDSAFYILK